MQRASTAAVTSGIDVPSDTVAGRALGERVARLVLEKLRR
jgi:hypothetical protein